ncbi:YraN family protein [bacterium]|nr:MAG: YraN family protein [bacterium]
MLKENLGLGRLAEEIAVTFLEENGFQILARNFRIRLGEVDIVAKEKDTFCFIEVKSKSSDRFGDPLEAVSLIKQRQISRVALSYLKENKLLHKSARFDVVSVVFTQSGPKIELIRDAFNLGGELSY